MYVYDWVGTFREERFLSGHLEHLKPLVRFPKVFIFFSFFIKLDWKLKDEEVQECVWTDTSLGCLVWVTER